MSMAIGYLVFGVIIFIVLFVGIVILQIFLSTNKNKWLGLILPVISLVLSFIVVFGFTLYNTVSGATFWTVVGQAGIPFLLFNIPTILLFVTYAICRETVKRKKNKEIERMNIQDLA